MREAIGGGWLFTIVIVFIILFTSFLALSINYSKAFKIKNDIITMIEKSNSNLLEDSELQEDISNYLNSVGYNVYGSCGSASDIDGSLPETGMESNLNSTGYKYCVAVRDESEDNLGRKYFKIKVFFRIDLPIFGKLFTFPVTGETKAIYFLND